MKKRIARSGAGKRGGYRAIVAHRRGGPWFFLMGYAKNAMENVDSEALHLCRAVASTLFSLSTESLALKKNIRELKEVDCDAQTKA